MKNMKNKNSDLISVIVPIYNVEKYLNRCIDSIINQTYRNLEIILVEDGSLDNCGKICDEYRNIDNRIIVIHQKNGGLSNARNNGLKKASGKYVAFIDSDDYIKDDYIEYLYNMIIKFKAEISILLPLEFNEGTDAIIKNEKEEIKIYSKYDALEVMLYQKEFDNSAWGKLYLKSVIKNIEFPFGKLYEDIGTVYKYILNSNKIVYSNLKKYYYLQRNTSIMGSKFKIQELDYIYQAENMMNDVKQMNNSKLTRASECRYINANFSILMKMKKTNEYEDVKAMIKKNIKKYSKSVFFNKKSRFKTKMAIILLYLGVI